jgi:EAL domain-containing protein (putative c-di-GMP-specific phosphodiesterase class I)
MNMAARDTAVATFDVMALRPNYQVISDTFTGLPKGFESLMRRMNPDGSISDNAEFRNEISEDEWPDVSYFLLAQDCRFAREVNAGRQAPLFVSFNAVPSVLTAPEFPDMMQAMLQVGGADASVLKIELLERDYAGVNGHGYNRMLENLYELKSEGHPIGIDDFPVGFSNQSRLADLADRDLVTDVKLDRSVLGMTFKERSAICRILDRYPWIQRTLEGVATEAHRLIAEEMGCDFFQGFLKREAVSPHEAIRLVNQSSDGYAQRHDALG